MSTASIETTHSDPTHREMVLAYMRKHGSITPREAQTFGCDRLAPRICEIRHKLKIPVTTTKEGKGRNKYARYSLATPVQLALL